MLAPPTSLLFAWHLVPAGCRWSSNGAGDSGDAPACTWSLCAAGSGGSSSAGAVPAAPPSSSRLAACYCEAVFGIAQLALAVPLVFLACSEARSRRRFAAGEQHRQRLQLQLAGHARGAEGGVPNNVPRVGWSLTHDGLRLLLLLGLIEVGLAGRPGRGAGGLAAMYRTGLALAPPNLCITASVTLLSSLEVRADGWATGSTWAGWAPARLAAALCLLPPRGHMWSFSRQPPFSSSCHALQISFRLPPSTASVPPLRVTARPHAGCPSLPNTYTVLAVPPTQPNPRAATLARKSTLGA